MMTIQSQVTAILSLEHADCTASCSVLSTRVAYRASRRTHAQRRTGSRTRAPARRPRPAGRCGRRANPRRRGCVSRTRHTRVRADHDAAIPGRTIVRSRDAGYWPKTSSSHRPWPEAPGAPRHDADAERWEVADRDRRIAERRRRLRQVTLEPSSSKPTAPACRARWLS
jgi:hypothetical protein